MKPRIQNITGRPRKYPFDSMAYGDSYLIPCEKKDAYAIGNRLGAAVRARKPSDYKITTKFIGEGVLIRKIKKS